jgi:hypothetical protein
VPELERAIHASIAHDIIGNVNCGRAALKMPL